MLCSKSASKLSRCLLTHVYYALGLDQGKGGYHTIDSGSTHNFIQPCIAKLLCLLIATTSAFLVIVDNGDTLAFKVVDVPRLI